MDTSGNRNPVRTARGRRRSQHGRQQPGGQHTQRDRPVHPEDGGGRAVQANTKLTSSVADPDPKLFVGSGSNPKKCQISVLRN